MYLESRASTMDNGLICRTARVVHFGFILPEEHHLEAKFGEPYRGLKCEIRRWV